MAGPLRARGGVGPRACCCRDDRRFPLEIADSEFLPPVSCSTFPLTPPGPRLYGLPQHGCGAPERDGAAEWTKCFGGKELIVSCTAGHHNFNVQIFEVEVQLPACYACVPLGVCISTIETPVSESIPPD